MQGTHVQSVIQEYCICHRATKAHVQLLSLYVTTAEACVPRACAPQWEKPPQ